jgi:heterodisulfide reductase subunit C
MRNSPEIEVIKKKFKNLGTKNIKNATESFHNRLEQAEGICELEDMSELTQSDKNKDKMI